VRHARIACRIRVDRTIEPRSTVDPIDLIASYRRHGQHESTSVSRLSWAAIVVFAIVVLALAVAVGQPARAECEARGGHLVASRASGLTCQLPK